MQDDTTDRPRTGRLQVILTVVSTPAGVTFALQKGRSELLLPYASTDATRSFAITLELGPALADGSLNFRGPFAQGTPSDRFVYLNSGTLAGDVTSRWERRAKIKLAGIPKALVEAASSNPDRAVEAHVVGTARDGGPVCASVPPDAITWSLALRPDA